MIPLQSKWNCCVRNRSCRHLIPWNCCVPCTWRAACSTHLWSFLLSLLPFPLTAFPLFSFPLARLSLCPCSGLASLSPFLLSHCLWDGALYCALCLAFALCHSTPSKGGPCPCRPCCPPTAIALRAPFALEPKCLRSKIRHAFCW